jgi:hypothetical protein
MIPDPLCLACDGGGAITVVAPEGQDGMNVTGLRADHLGSDAEVIRGSDTEVIRRQKGSGAIVAPWHGEKRC